MKLKNQMVSRRTLKLIPFAVAAAFLFLMACAPKADGPSATRQVARGKVNVPAEANNFNYQVIDLSQNSNSYDVATAARELLRPSVDLAGVGDILDVKMVGYIHVDSTGKMIPESSFILFQIIDSYVNSGMQPYYVEVPGSSGQASSTAHLVFADDKGSVTIDGTFAGALPNLSFSGKVGFQNLDSSGAQTFGTFQIDASRFFRW